MTNFQKSNHDLAVLLAELQSRGSGELRITPKDGKLLAEVFAEKNNKKKRIACITLDFPLLGGDSALPIFSKVEYDATTDQIQQRFPVEACFRAQHVEYETHLAGKRPKKRATRPYPLSNPSYRVKSNKKTIRTKRRITPEDLKRLAATGGLNFLKPQQ